MNSAAEHAKEIEQARANLEDLRKRGEDAIGGDALELLQGLLTPEELSASNLRVAIMGELIKARKEQGLSQKKLEELSGVKQPIIARMERGTTSPQVDTVLKVLAPLGMTLAVVPMKRKTRLSKKRQAKTI